MLRALAGLVVLLPAVVSFADAEPLADWSVHTIATDGPSTYEGEKTRAVLTYGESGRPKLVIEKIRVEMGYPEQSEVSWRAEVDLTGDRPDPCPIAETYCAEVRDLRWLAGRLKYDLIGGATTLRCTVSNAKEGSPKTRCERT